MKYNLVMKKLFLIFLIFSFFAGMICPVSADIIKGYAEKSDEYRQMKEDLFTGSEEKLDKNDIINMTVSQVLDSNISIEGDEFFAEVTTDVYGNKGIIIPKGTIAHGKILEKTEAKRLGRPASISLDFDYLVTPDGREIPIEGRMSTQMHPVVQTAKIAAQDVGYTVVGGAVGGFMALNWLGIEAAVASQGYTLAGGAAVGGAIGLGMALIRKGSDVLIAPGDEIRIKVNKSVSLPVYRNEALMQHELFYPGLDVQITSIEHEKDPFGELNTITLTILISNMSDKVFSGLDMALVNDYNAVFRPSVFGDTKILFKQLNPGDKALGKISFAVDNLHRNFWLTFYDKRTKTPLAKISVDNAYKNVSKKIKKHNEKVRLKNTNFKKEESIFDIE